MEGNVGGAQRFRRALAPGQELQIYREKGYCSIWNQRKGASKVRIFNLIKTATFAATIEQSRRHFSHA